MLYDVALYKTAVEIIEILLLQWVTHKTPSIQQQISSSYYYTTVPALIIRAYYAGNFVW